jgi:ATP-binding protein involved in chromosome partitioning
MSPRRENDGRNSPARHAIAIGSGKGGVGKSTVSLNIALALAHAGALVGLLDADLYGPNIPLMVGLKRDRWLQSWTLARSSRLAAEPSIPPMERYGLEIMSAGFLIAEDQPMILDGATVTFMVQQLVRQVAWGDLDYLVVDLPPGTADVQQCLFRELPLSGAVLVVTPQDVAHLDARKGVQMIRRAGLPLLGAVENMSGFHCPHCDQPVDIFSRAPDSRAIWSLGVDLLGRIPLDPALSRAGDAGQPLQVAHPESPQAQAFRNVAQRIAHKLEAASLAK